MTARRAPSIACSLAAALLILLPRQASGDDPAGTPESLRTAFDRDAAPFLNNHCARCHNAEEMTSGVRVDHLDAALEERQLKLWEGIRRQLDKRAMPPEDEPQPSDDERQRMLGWISRALDFARSRPTPKNGGVRRLTVDQYRVTLRELLSLEDDIAESLPADAVSRDGFVNNQETLQLSPLLLEAYLEIAERALERCLVDPARRPTIQRFRVDLGKRINPEPCPDSLILGANSLLLDNADFVVSQPLLEKPFPFEPFRMRTQYRFIEGYQGNDTVRGWREYDSIYHAVFACLRGQEGYPKGNAYETVPEGLLLRPAIPSAEIFQVESTYGPRANFKISLRELPDEGQFRVTVQAAKYDDGLLLEPNVPARPDQQAAVVVRQPQAGAEVMVERPGIYQVDAYLANESALTPDASRLDEGLIGAWPLANDARGAPPRDELTGRLEGDAKFIDTPLGRALSLDGEGDAVVVPRHASLGVGAGEFTVAAWIHPRQLRQAGIVCLGKYSWTHGWYLDMPNNQGVLRIETAGPNNQPHGTVASAPGTLRVDTWQHVAAVVRRGEGATALYVNGYPVAKGTIGAENLDNPRVDLQIGRIQDAQQFQGELADVRLYRRALAPSEIQALLERGREFVPPTPPRAQPRPLRLTLGERQFSGLLRPASFLAVRLPVGPLTLGADYAGELGLDRIVLTPLGDDDVVARRFATFERRVPKLGVHLGLRRDCGSTLAPVESPRPVRETEPTPFVFAGAIRNFPSPDVEPDNVNYLAGIREIGVRSEYTDGRDMPRLLIRSVEFEGPYYDQWPPAPHRAIFFDADDAREDAGYAREIVRRFATRAYRRPVADEELSALLAVCQQSRDDGASFRESVRDALLVVLTSPQFLFQIERSESPEAEPLDDHELATKLSYFLWNGPPDPTTLALAERGELRPRLDAELDRLVADARFARFLDQFASQWLALHKFDVLEPDRQRFPRLTRDTRAELRREPAALLGHLIRENLSARELIESDIVVVNEVVASYYDLGERTESGFEFVPVRHERSELGGVLSLASVLAGLSDGREPNPVKRGAWLARKIIAEPPDDPPPNVPALAEDTRQLSLRERLERHRSQPGCADCHSRIDPWGVPFEEFDAGGRLRTTPVDARSTLPDRTEVAGMAELRRYLADERLDQVAYSLLLQLSLYATGRDLSYNERDFLRREGARLRADGYRLRDMIRFVVHSPMFLEK